MLSTSRVISPFALASPDRDRARGVVARGRRDDRAAVGGRRGDARGGQPAAGLPCAGGRGAARPGRPAGARPPGTLRLRPAGALLSADAARALRSARSWRANHAGGRSGRPARGGACADRRAGRHGGAGLARVHDTALGHGARPMAVGRCGAGRPRHRSRLKSRGPAPASTSGRACRNGKSRRPRRRRAASRSSRARRGCAWPS